MATVVNQTLVSGKLTVIDLGDRTCIPCKKMAPILEGLSKEYKGKVSSPCATPVLKLLTLIAGKGLVLYGIALLFCYAIGHSLLMLFVGTFTGFVEGFVKARGVVNFSLWAKRVSGAVVALVGSGFVWRSF